MILLLFIGCQSKHQEDVADDPNASIDIKLDEYFTALMALKQFNGVVLVEKDDKMVFSSAYNLSNDPNSSTYVTENHQFDLRSISKLIAKYAVYKLKEEGKISVNDPINNYFMDFPNGEIITIRHLMYNQSGLPRELSDESVNLFEVEPPELMELIKGESLEFEPGSDTRYSNLGFQLLYYIIEKINSKSFAQYVQDEIYDPLKMTSSGAHFYTDRNNLKNFAAYHTMQDDRL